MMAQRSDSQAKATRDTNPYRAWAARFWHGMPMQTWLPLLWEHGSQTRFTRTGLAATVTFASVINTAMQAMQSLWLGRKIENTKLVGDPIFIIGHWRSGTTLLHELMVLDDQFTYPTTYECFAPRTSWCRRGGCRGCDSYCRRSGPWTTC